MPTTLRSFPQVNRSGTQQTAYVNLPDAYQEIQLKSQAADATHSDPLNGIRFEILHSPSGVGDADAVVIQSEDWTGGTFTPKGGGAPIPNAVNTTFGPIPATGAVALKATFNRVINIGATLVGLP